MDRKQQDHSEGQTGEPIQDRYGRELREFFLGNDHAAKANDRTSGHLWIERHEEGFETLVIEPPEGGQFEVAVRMKATVQDCGMTTRYVGYSIGYGRLNCHGIEH